MTVFTRRAALVAAVTLIASLTTPAAFAMGRSGAPTPPAKQAAPANADVQAQVEALRKELADLKAQLALNQGVAAAR